MSTPNSSILVVDDEQALADLYVDWLERDYDVRAAYDGETALAELDAEVDYVFLDRRMPGMTGDEVVSEIRAGPRDPKIVIVSAIEPDFDILDLDIRRYLVKPITPQDLEDVIDRLSELTALDPPIRRYDQLAHKCAVVSDAKPDRELARNDRYRAIISDLEDLADSIGIGEIEALGLPTPKELD